MRHTFDTTKQTIKVLTGHQAEIAEEANVSDKYLYAILAGTETDFFAPFEHYYSACVRAGAPVCHYDNRLAAIRARYEKLAPVKTEFECLSEKINANADTTSRMVDALRDGQINEVEAEKILNAIEKERNVLDIIETMMQFKVVPEVRKQVRRFVKSTGNR